MGGLGARAQHASRGHPDHGALTNRIHHIRIVPRRVSFLRIERSCRDSNDTYRQA